MTDTVIALLPIHPEYADAILDGMKKVEFRKRVFKKEVRRILIYACHPVMSLVGYFDVDDITETTPKQAWKEFGDQGCIKKDAYSDYYSDADKAVAIRIRKAVKFDKPVKLSVIDKNISPPQSFRYICSNQFDKVLKKSGNSTS
jgi:predicted transcriptional regulator